MQEYITDNVITNLVFGMHDLYISDTAYLQLGKVIAIDDISNFDCPISSIVEQIKSRFLISILHDIKHVFKICVRWDFTESLCITYNHIKYIFNTPSIECIQLHDSTFYFSITRKHFESTKNSDLSFTVSEILICYHSFQDIVKGG